MMETMVNFEDEEYIRLSGKALVSAVAAALERACTDEEPVESTIPKCFLGRKQLMSMESYVQRLYEFMDCSDVVFITALVYLDRLEIANSNNRLTPQNVHRLFATAMLLAVKYQDDEIFDNSYYSRVFGFSNLAETNHFEATLLCLLDFRVAVSEKEYLFYKTYLIQSTPQTPTQPEFMLSSVPVASAA
uniref:Cyclin n=1 Tax=Rhodosorus marinus TaxID=101924 RepID=A0A7S0G5I9_9RHOD|mmetsp:Transcript_8593/g.12601  ORF Transcript_8593/g.12601 Transcript_8593/m.12601 type:complete len:189 (+) Transcript_8593:53-619(+)